LDAAEVSQRLKKYGPNRLPEAARQGPLLRFLLQFNNVLVYVLLVAGFIKLMTNLWLDASIILGVVLINGLLGFIQEGKAEKALDLDRNHAVGGGRTVRGGGMGIDPAEEVGPGGIRVAETGDKVAAGPWLADCKNLGPEEAALTGESVPTDKSTDPVSAKATV